MEKTTATKIKLNQQQLKNITGGTNWKRVGMCTLSMAAGGAQDYLETAGNPFGAATGAILGLATC